MPSGIVSPSIPSSHTPAKRLLPFLLSSLGPLPKPQELSAFLLLKKLTPPRPTPPPLRRKKPRISYRRSTLPLPLCSVSRAFLHQRLLPQIASRSKARKRKRRSRSRLLLLPPRRTLMLLLLIGTKARMRMLDILLT